MSFLRHIGYRAHALWVPFVFLLFSGTRGVGIFEPARGFIPEQNFAEGAPLERSILLLLMGISVLIVARRRVFWRSLFARNAPVLLLFALMAASILWSPLPWVSFKRFVKAVGLLGVLAVLLTDDDPYQALKFLLRRFCWFALPLSLIYVYFLPALGVGYAFDGSAMRIGVCLSKNNLGQAAAVGVLVGMFGVCERDAQGGRFWNLALLGIAGCTLLATHSATSLLVALCGIGVLLLIALSAYASIGYAGAIVALTLALALAGGKLFEELVLRRPLMPLVIEAVGRDPTLTGRTDLWRDVFALASRHPVIGHGFGSLWIGDEGVAGPLWREYIWKPNQAHCGYLDVYAELGWLGLGLLAIVVLIGVLQSFAMLRTNYYYGRARLVLIATVCAANVTESSFCRAIQLFWFVALAALMSPAAPRQADKTPRQPAPVAPGVAQGGV